MSRLAEGDDLSNEELFAQLRALDVGQVDPVAGLDQRLAAAGDEPALVHAGLHAGSDLAQVVAQQEREQDQHEETRKRQKGIGEAHQGVIDEVTVEPRQSAND